MSCIRSIASAVVFLGLARSAVGQNTTLVETTQAGECFRYSVKMQLDGEMVVVQDGKSQSLKLAASADHRFRERVLAVDKSGNPVKAARFYDTAIASISVDGSNSQRTLRSDRRLTVAVRNNDTLTCFSPQGPLTRDELENVSEHFDTLAITGILPGRELKVGESWKLPNAIAQSLCQFEALISTDIECKLEGVKDGVGLIVVNGQAKGIELGAAAAVTVSATARYDVAKKRVIGFEWKQTDRRDQGPATPAVNAKTTITVERSLIDEPKELSDTALVAVPQGLEVPAPLTLLTFRDPRGRFELSAARDWQLVGQTDRHTVFRLMDRGDFVAQATVTAWEKAEPGQHVDPKKWREMMVSSPGWAPEELVQEGELPNQPAGRWVYRVTARGTINDAKVLQTFYVIANARGEQAVVTFTFKQSQAGKLGARDQILVDGLEILK